MTTKKQTIAVIGASPKRHKFGNKCVRAFARKGFDVFPINPTATDVEGYKAYRKITDLPIRPDMVSVYLNPALGMQVIDEIAEKGTDLLWLNPGAESPELIAKAKGLGLNVRAACSIVAIGVSPMSLED